MTLAKTYLGKLRTDLHAYALIRRDVINQSGIAQHHAKRAIFALHRGNNAEAASKLKEAGDIFAALVAKYKKHPQIKDEGAFEAGVEEFVEAQLFYQFVTTGKIGELKGMKVDAGSYLGGLCDVPGELYRYAIRAATNRDMETVKRCADLGSEIIGELIEFDLTSYLRNKFDQAKQAAQKLEQVVYEVSLREKT